MSWFTTNSVAGIICIVLALLVGATAGITLLAIIASEALRVVFSSFGDRDTELCAGEGSDE